MRASILTFIFIISEYSIISGGDGQCGNAPKVENAEKKVNSNESFRMKCKDGYKRQAGTSDLFKCKNKEWINNPPLVCMIDPLRPLLKFTLPPPNTTPEMDYKTTQPDKNTSTVSGKIVSTTTQTASTTPRTSSQTSQRTTAMEKETVTTSITTRNTVSPTSHSSSSLSSTSTDVTVSMSPISSDRETGITAGIIIFVIIAGLAATVAILLFRRRSRLHGAIGHSIEMKTDNSGSDHPLIKTQAASSSCPSESIQPPVTPFKESPEDTYSDVVFSA